MQNEKVPAAMQDNVTQADRIWLWRNGPNRFVAYDNPFPTADGGDPLTLGEPSGWAELKASVNGRPEYPTEQVERDIARASTTEAVQKLVDAAEDKAWREARELVRGTNADLCKTGEQAYRIIQKGITDAVNNRNLRTLKGRVAAHRESQP